QAGDREIARHLYFRDYLKSHPAEAKKYADLKIKLAQKLPHDRRGYVQNKQGYVEALEKKAIAWVRDLK
ncbi:GrpB family protein, partial [Coxiella burnetii]